MTESEAGAGTMSAMGRDPSRSHAGTDRKFRLGALVFALAGFVAAYSGTLAALWRVWMRNENYSHGFLIGPIAVWLVWRERANLKQEATAGSAGGISLLLVAFVFQLVGLRGDVVTIQGLSLVLAIAGVVWSLFGTRVMRRTLFPIAFLIFMIPTLPWFVNTLSFRLKILSARNAVAIAHSLGIVVQRSGVNLIFSEGTLAVENACSGLRSLVALMALGALFGHMSNGAGWKRISLFVLALPIAVLANTLRIAALCVYAGMGDVAGAAGTFHEVGGYALFGVAFLLLLLGKRILRC
jgi:exosortase